MTDYIEYMKALSDHSLTKLLSGVKSVYLTDLPDHPNVGDSAIALGEFSFLRRHQIEVAAAYSVGTLDPRISEGDVPVLIHGGGNLGGLYPQYDLHRQRLHDLLPEDRLIIQAPQTVDFIDHQSRTSFLAGIGARSNLRIGVRDTESAHALAQVSGTVAKAPDAFHSFGAVRGSDPTRLFLVLSRTDGERADRPTSRSVDWPADQPALAFATRVRKHSSRLPFLGHIVNPTPRAWERISKSRFARGAKLIEMAEVIVTDRLHAMLMALQMGRRVIAVDNATRKLSRYAETWFGPAQPRLEFVRSFEEGVQRAR